MRFFSIFLLFCLGLCLPTFAQDSPWFRYDLTYYKIQTAATGIYRIPASRLTVFGIPFKRLDPRNLRLYHRGKEVAVLAKNYFKDIQAFEHYLARKITARFQITN